MKKTIFLILLLAAAATVSAQLRWGIRGGVNLSFFSSVEYEANAPRYYDLGSGLAEGFHLGGYAKYALGRRLAVQAELLFSAQGTLGGDIGRLRYINLPLLLKFKPFASSPFGLSVGVQGGWCFSNSGTAYRPLWDFSVPLGVEYDFGEHLTLGLHYNHGFVNMVDRDDEVMRAKGAQNRVIQLSVGWTF